ncbi:hypothetical protein E5676_scaffold1121G00230 [Cucumis melo var. makuwa]|uniref:Uncharacterized protein n=1 Tax=Cucumis melo var. makuwa TaxID=1194695 RepID=A0A5D3CR37_CUCMM|nr:hypothetical protein E5676_scaffold1121G00230 [Cucumis melo var. makuwa]
MLYIGGVRIYGELSMPIRMRLEENTPYCRSRHHATSVLVACLVSSVTVIVTRMNEGVASNFSNVCPKIEAYLFFHIAFFPTNRANINTTRDGVLPTSKNVDANKKYVGKGYPDVPNGVEKNVGRGFPDVEICVGIDCIENTSFPTQTMLTRISTSGKPLF